MKFILKLELEQQILFKEIVDNILIGNLDGLDITKMKGINNFYRCRKGKIRIIFYKDNNNYYINDIDFRGRVYKKY